MTIEIEYETPITLDLDYESIIKSVIDQALEYENCPYDVQINVILTDDQAIWEMNKEQRGIDCSTDVLSFPMIEYEIPSDFSRVEEQVEDYFDPETGELVLGDIVISVEKIVEQAKKYGHSQKRELAFLTAHSMLHLFGYDHMEMEEAQVMEKKQEDILNLLEIYR